MGWLFAVSRGMQERSRRAVLRSLAPIAIGHEAGDRARRPARARAERDHRSAAAARRRGRGAGRLRRSSASSSPARIPLDLDARVRSRAGDVVVPDVDRARRRADGRARACSGCGRRRAAATTTWRCSPRRPARRCTAGGLAVTVHVGAMVAVMGAIAYVVYQSRPADPAPGVAEHRPGVGRRLRPRRPRHADQLTVGSSTEEPRMDNPVTRVCLLGGFSVATGGWPRRGARVAAAEGQGAGQAPRARARAPPAPRAPGRGCCGPTATPKPPPTTSTRRCTPPAARSDADGPARCSDGVVALEAEVDVDAFEAAAAARARHRRGRRLRRGARPPRRRAAARGSLRAVGRRAPRRAARAPRRPVRRAGRAVTATTPQAVAALQRALVVDPLPSPPTARSCASTRATGRRQQALAQYQLLRQQLDAELAAEPDPETRGLYRELLRRAEPATRRAAATCPIQLTSFVGRERERGEIARLLDRVRLLTLIGPGGCGKTRLALETLAADGAAPDGIWFVELAGLTDRALVAAGDGPGRGRPDSGPALGAGGARGAPGGPPGAHRARQLRARHRRLRAPGRGPPARRARRARAGHEPRAAALRGRGGLARPVAGRGRAACSSSAPPRRSRGFEPDRAATTATIEEICQRLDGMPLAIELAAARVAALSLDQIAARLGDSLDVLAGGSRTALHPPADAARHASTGATTCSPARSACSSAAWRSSRAASRWRRPRRSAPAAPIARRQDRRPARAAGRQVARESSAGRALPPARHHPPVRRRAPRRRRASTTRSAVRHLDWCLALAQEHDPLSAGPRRSLRTLEIEHDNLRAGLDLRAAPRSAGAPCVWPRRCGGSGWTAATSPRATAGSTATLVAAPERTAAARRGAAGGRRALAAQRRLRAVPARVQRRGRRLPRAGRRARDRRRAQPARHARAVRQPHRARRGALRRGAWPSRAGSATGACWPPPRTRRR